MCTVKHLMPVSNSMLFLFLKGPQDSFRQLLLHFSMEGKEERDDGLSTPRGSPL